MKFGVVVFPGSNCDHDCYHVLKDALGQDTTYIWHKDRSLDGCDCIVLPGGFSYGDYLRTGAIARFSPIMSEVEGFAKKGGIVIGICNGFQVLLESGLLPGAMRHNDSVKFVCKFVNLRTENIDTPFTNRCSADQILRIPVAHGEGNYYVDDNTLKSLNKENRIIFRYCDKNGELTPDANPNGSLENIAGIVNRSGNVLGMMPHPERCSEPVLGFVDGKIIFESIIQWLKK